MSGKTKAFIAHITWIGWIVALILNSSEKDEMASFYIRQLLGIYLLSIVIMLFKSIPLITSIGGILVFVLWILSLIGALNGEQKLTPVIGKNFQDWFKAL